MLVILAGNSIAFVVIFYSLLTSGSKVTAHRKTTGLQQARQGAAVLVLLGLTWLFGVLAINDAKIVFQYLFCIFNSLQGLLVFVFYCALPTESSKKYRNFWQKKMATLRGKRRSYIVERSTPEEGYCTERINYKLNGERNSESVSILNT